MSAQPRVTFDHVWKKFHRGERHDSLRDLIPALARRLGRRPRPTDLDNEEFWALRDVSFEVRSGEALGIIGHNGAGKSTVLKTLTKILRPTLGTCQIRGRAGALIEVAAGFHPELTGIENVFLQGAIMGMKRAEIAQRLDAILDFAAVGAFVHTPVKRYSSGMNARLGFSVAAHLNPDVLIIDEVLAVGDVSFQDKCERRMQEFKRSGVAIVFVSHNLAAVERLCERALLMEQGSPVVLGPSHEVIPRYLTASAQAQPVTESSCKIHASVSDEHAQKDGTRCRPGQRIRLDVELEFEVSTPGANVGFSVWSFRTGTYVYEASSQQAGLDVLVADAGDRRRFSLEFEVHLTRGLYRVDLDVFEPSTQSCLGSQTGALVLTVAERTSQNGVANLYLSVSKPGGPSIGPAEREEAALL
jgi:lipopolysaccharide transport system ATP-binding protein